MTDRQADDAPTLRDSTDREQVLADAGRVYRYVARHPFIEEEALRVYGERNDLPPDRLNAALAFLAETGQLVGLQTSAAADTVLTPLAQVPVEREAA